MPIRVYYEVLNQKNTPALYSDNYAQRPAAGFVGRIFIVLILRKYFMILVARGHY